MLCQSLAVLQVLLFESSTLPVTRRLLVSSWPPWKKRIAQISREQRIISGFCIFTWCIRILLAPPRSRKWLPQYPSRMHHRWHRYHLWQWILQTLVAVTKIMSVLSTFIILWTYPVGGCKLPPVIHHLIHHIRRHFILCPSAKEKKNYSGRRLERQPRETLGI